MKDKQPQNAPATRTPTRQMRIRARLVLVVVVFVPLLFFVDVAPQCFLRISTLMLYMHHI
jgi:hypothetical protein